ncbi:hypothetical protein PROFUN_15714, partial [Planoprotostelium fungivorum]
EASIQSEIRIKAVNEVEAFLRKYNRNPHNNQPKYLGQPQPAVDTNGNKIHCAILPYQSQCKEESNLQMMSS